MSRGVSNKTKKLTISAILCAMGVVLLILGAFIEVLDISMAAIASFLCIFAVIELGGVYPWMIFAVTSVLSIIIMPQSSGGWFYLLFFGYYPILKEKLERLPSFFSWIIKFAILNLSLVISITVTSFLFYGGDIFDAFILLFGGEESGTYMAIGIYVLLNFVFFIYDIALTRLISTYFVKLRPRFKFLK